MQLRKQGAKWLKIMLGGAVYEGYDLGIHVLTRLCPYHDSNGSLRRER